VSNATRRLLVVDDEVEFAEFVRELAGRHGFQVETAQNGSVAKQRFRAFLPDTIVLDIVMPQTDGIEFIGWLGRMGTNVRLVVVTGFDPHYGDLAEKLAEARGLSSVAVLTKPVRVATLLEALGADSV
jgi:DNA-binding response OmpR family regulator